MIRFIFIFETKFQQQRKNLIKKILKVTVNHHEHFLYNILGVGVERL